MRQTKITLEGEDINFVRDRIVNYFKQKGIDVEIKGDNMLIVKIYGE